jgi:nucleoside-diphosphate-sugar epimerase
LVPGALGFVGRHLIAHILQKGDSVFGIDLSPEFISENGMTGNWYFGDIRNADFCMNLFNEIKPNIIYHLTEGMNSPILSDLISINVQGTLNLLETLRLKALEAKLIYWI